MWFSANAICNWSGYLNQAARAVRAVCTRRKELELAGRMQASLLPENPPNIDGWQLAAIAVASQGNIRRFLRL